MKEKSNYIKPIFTVMAIAFAVVFFIIASKATAKAAPGIILGSEEIVFDWTTDRCDMEDIPDLPARAFRDANGKVQLIATHFINRRMIGNDIASVTRDCDIIMASHKDADPSKYNDREWISSVYTKDGVNIHALVHNEYQGNAHPGMCPSRNYFDCWYNSITYASSVDMGKTYTHVPAPQHRVANVPYKYVAGDGPYGIFAGSNIILNSKDSYYYMLLHLEAYGAQDWGVGVMRTQTLEDPASWRCWDGEGFNATFIDPYTEENYVAADHICEPVSRDNIEKMNESLTYNKFFNKYLLVGATGLYDPNVGEVVWGFYYSLSDDLINWSPRKLIMKAKLWWTPSLPGDSYGYPSLIDPNDNSMNFNYTDKKAYLYYTRWHNGTTYDRDLVRVSIEFTNTLFIDVPPGYWAEEAIYKIYNAGITKGCSQNPLMYCPDNTVTRTQMAVFLGRATHGSEFTPPTATGIFSDVPVSYWAADWIEQFYHDGITSGCNTNPLRYCPGNNVTRAQMAIFLLRAKHGKNYTPPSATGIFSDVPTTYWAADWIEQLYNEGITTGCGTGPLRYCPENSVTRAQMAVFMMRTIGL
jgi:S-layer homology domain